jgi:hypothetical protein
MRDYPRGFRNGFFRRCCLAVSDSLAITPALPVASLFSQKRRSHPFSRQQRVRGRRPGGWPASRSSGGSLASSSGPTGVWLPEAHALEGTLIPLRGAAGSGPAQTQNFIADQPSAARASFSLAWRVRLVGPSGPASLLLSGKRLRLNG